MIYPGPTGGQQIWVRLGALSDPPYPPVPQGFTAGAYNLPRNSIWGKALRPGAPYATIVPKINLGADSPPPLRPSIAGLHLGVSQKCKGPDWGYLGIDHPMIYPRNPAGLYGPAICYQGCVMEWSPWGHIFVTDADLGLGRARPGPGGQPWPDHCNIDQG